MKVIKACRERTMGEQQELAAAVNEIVRKVREEKDKALIAYNTSFDGNTRTGFKVTREEIQAAYSMVDENIIEDIKFAAKNIKAFARAQKATFCEEKEIEIYPGVYLGHRKIPMEACCCYVPGGSYPLFSTALMLAIPAKVAGVKRVTACSPTIKNSQSINPLTLVALDIAEVDEIYALGGAHAVAAFAYGTEQIKPVDIIVGPGNRYVTEAKRQCYGQVGIDFIAGPSEVLVIGDSSAKPEIVAADLLGQSEHDINAKGIFVTTEEKLGYEVIREVETQLSLLPTKEIAEKAWRDNGEIIVVETIEEACKISNDYAPEHLELIAEAVEELVPKLNNYGSLFIGEMSAEVFGDYVSGTNHTLPTLKASRYTGGVWVGTFIKTCTHQRLTEASIKVLSPIASRLAKAEGLYAHAKAAEIRLK